MKSLADAAKQAQAELELAQKRARWKRNDWCRQRNDDCDRPILRVAARRLAVPLYQVIAFTRRLDSLANKGEPRGSVEDFDPDEFGEALGMPPDEAARIFETLKDEKIAWIVYGHVADFYDRNRDSDSAKESAKERKRRSRGKKDGLAILAGLAARGEITPDQRTDVERQLHLPPRVFSNEDFFKLLDDLYRADLSTGGSHKWSQCDPVTVTPEQTTTSEQNSRAVDNFSGVARGGTEEGLSGEAVDAPAGDPQAQALRWIAIEGRRIVIERMPHEQPGRVDTLLQRWCDQDLAGDAAGLMTVILQCSRLQTAGAAFHVAVTNACATYRRLSAAQREKQGTLPLGGVQAVKRGGANG